MDLTQRTLDLIRAANNPNMGRLRKSGFTTSTGVVGISLEKPSRLLVPQITPLRNLIPRSPSGENGMNSTAEKWKVVTAINSTNVRAGVSEGNRNAVISRTVVDKTASYVGLGLEDTVTFEADYASRGFEDVRASSVMQLLMSMYIQEERIILNGNASLALGTTPTPTGVASTTGGSLATNATHFIFCAALTWWGYTAAGGEQNPVASTGVLAPTQTRSNADNSSDVFGNGVSQISAQSSAVSVTGPTGSIAATVTPVKGAFGYAWFLGTTTGAANCNLVAVSYLPTVVLKSLPTATYPANSTGLNADHSTCGLEFDGLITSALTLNGYYKSLAGGTLTADGAGGVVELEAMLKYFWDTNRTTVQTFWMDSLTLQYVNKKITAASTNPSFRVNIDNSAASLGNMIGGNLVTTYLNKYSVDGATTIDLRIHPDMPTGCIYADMVKNPYPLSGIPMPRRMRVRQEYYQKNWPERTRKWEVGVYVDEFLQIYMGFGTGVICDIAAG